MRPSSGCCTVEDLLQSEQSMHCCTLPHLGQPDGTHRLASVLLRIIPRIIIIRILAKNLIHQEFGFFQNVCKNNKLVLGKLVHSQRHLLCLFFGHTLYKVSFYYLHQHFLIVHNVLQNNFASIEVGKPQFSWYGV